MWTLRWKKTERKDIQCVPTTSGDKNCLGSGPGGSKLEKQSSKLETLMYWVVSKSGSALELPRKISKTFWFPGLLQTYWIEFWGWSPHVCYVDSYLGDSDVQAWGWMISQKGHSDRVSLDIPKAFLSFPPQKCSHHHHLPHGQGPRRQNKSEVMLHNVRDEETKAAECLRPHNLRVIDCVFPPAGPVALVGTWERGRD